MRVTPSDAWTKRIILVNSIAGFLIIHSLPCSAQSRDVRAVRAAYLFNLMKFVTWPPEKSDLLIGVLGNRETGETIHKLLDGKKMDGRSIRVLLSASEDDVRRCSIVYFVDVQASRSKAVLADLKNLVILTAAQHARMTISSHVLNLADRASGALEEAPSYRHWRDPR